MYITIEVNSAIKMQFSTVYMCITLFTILCTYLFIIVYAIFIFAYAYGCDVFEFLCLEVGHAGGRQCLSCFLLPNG